jgi:Na+-transporting methylmalonyl-CoA/oxaloacetate decarboxylase gamma subunit
MHKSGANMQENLIVSLEMLAVGMSGVFASLAFFAVVIWLMKLIDSKLKKVAIENINTALSEQDATEIIPFGVGDEILSVISAVVASTLGSNARVKTIQFLNNNAQGGQWSQYGRQNVMSGHNIISKR